MSDLHTIEGVEIFKSGRWNGDAYTDRDLDEMVRNFDKVGYAVPLKLGHDEKSGQRAWGWVSALYRRGSTLVADLRDIPSKLWDAIKDRAYDAISSEIYWDLTRGGEVFSRALKAVAILGCETPAVSGLAPLRSVVNSMDATFERVGTYAFKNGERNMQTLDALLCEKVRAFQLEHPEYDFGAAAKFVMAANPELNRQWGSQSTAALYANVPRTPVKKFSIADAEQPAIYRELDQRARKYMDDSNGKCCDYGAAVKHVLATDPTLSEQYRQQTVN